LDPKGKVALITGGARIGQTVAHALAARGCALALTYRGSRAAADATAVAARAMNVPATVIRADATNEADVEAAVGGAARSLGRLDILINMVSIYAKTVNPTAADWSSALDATARSTFLFPLTRHLS
jgi:3-oxoacyl-[acyl-carrier protein] reductase